MALFIFDALVFWRWLIQKNYNFWPDWFNSFSSYYGKFDKFVTIDSILEKEFLDPDQLSGARSNMIENSLKAYVAGLNDPFSNYLTKDESKQLNEILHDQTWISWIWAVVEKKDTYIQIQEVIKNWPARKVGLLPLDRIIFIETGSTTDLDTSQAVQLIRWKKWTIINLSILRQDKDWNFTGFEIAITRDNIEIPSVTTDTLQIKDKKIWLFTISSISDSTTRLFVNEVLEFWQISGIILDLRWNGWWYLEEAIKFLWHFLPKWEIVVQSEYKGFEPLSFSSNGRWELWHLPIVILIDQLTASAGEIIAIALQENWVSVVGMPSFGKWTIQSVQELYDGSSLKLTIWKWLSPSGIWVNWTWIIPNFEVEFDWEKYADNQFDNQLEKAKEILTTQIK